ncbi:MAG: hypothetical protein JXB07_08745 [Anaerolineae bacterium]|nr:hypothetical protein [Anaerolineae bacterium]
MPASIGWAPRYFYDDAGNILKMIRPDTGTTLYAYNGANQVATACTDANTNNLCDPNETQFAYQHDAYGNLTNDGQYEYIYAAANRLIELKVSGQTVATSGYNGDGDLISVTVLGTTTEYVRDWVSLTYPGEKTTFVCRICGERVMAPQTPGKRIQHYRARRAQLRHGSSLPLSVSSSQESG